MKKNHNAFKSELQGLSHVQSTLHGDAIANIIHNFRMLSVTSAGNSPFRLRSILQQHVLEILIIFLRYVIHSWLLFEAQMHLFSNHE